MSDYTLSAQLLGAEKLLNNLSKSADYAKQELAKALNKAANDLQNKAVANAPKQTGRLKSSIHTQEAIPENLKAIVGTKLVYARAQEYGTQGMTIHSHSKLGKQFTYIGNIRPKMYLHNAYDDIRPKLSGYLQEASRRIIEHLSGL